VGRTGRTNAIGTVRWVEFLEEHGAEDGHYDDSCEVRSCRTQARIGRQKGLEVQ